MYYYICPSRNNGKFIFYNSCDERMVELTEIDAFKLKLLNPSSMLVNDLGKIDFKVQKTAMGYNMCFTFYGKEVVFELESHDNYYNIVGKYSWYTVKLSGNYKYNAGIKVSNMECLNFLRNNSDFGNLDVDFFIDYKASLSTFYIELYLQLFERSSSLLIKVIYDYTNGTFYVRGLDGIINKLLSYKNVSDG